MSASSQACRSKKFRSFRKSSAVSEKNFRSSATSSNMNIFPIATSRRARSRIAFQMHHSLLRKNEYQFFRFFNIFTKSRCRVIFHFHLVVIMFGGSQTSWYIIGGGTIRHGAYQQRTFNPFFSTTSVCSRCDGKISICPTTTSASNAVGSGEFDADLKNSPQACSTPLLLSGSSVKNLQSVGLYCRLLER